MAEQAVGAPRVAFGEGFEAYAAADMPRLLRLGAMLARDGDAARDLTQETLVRVGLAWSRIDRDGNPAAYATTTMSRLAWRQQGRRLTELRLLTARRHETRAYPDDFGRIADSDELRAAMASLGPPARGAGAALLLRPVRGRARPDAGLLGRHREEPDRSWPGQRARAPRHPGRHR